MIELQVKLKDSERSNTQKFLIYEVFEMSQDSEIIKDCIKEALKSFPNDEKPDKVTVRAILEIV